MVGVDPNPFHGFDPRRLVSLCPSFDFGLGIAFARTYVASFACCETQFNERQHAAEHTRVQLPPGTAQPSVLAAELFEVKEPSHHRAALSALALVHENGSSPGAACEPSPCRRTIGADPSGAESTPSTSRPPHDRGHPGGSG